MSPLAVGLVAGTACGASAVATTVPLKFARKRAALIGAFLNRFAIGLLIPLVACDKRPINPTAALPAPGSPIPAFAFPAYGAADSVRSTDLVTVPTVVALWSTHCPYQGAWVVGLDRLAREYRRQGVRVIVLADDAPGQVLDSVLARAAWRAVVSGVGVADGGLAKVFDRSRDAPERERERVEFVLPSFLLVAPDGRVVRRSWGPSGTFRPALDSLLQPASAASPGLNSLGQSEPRITAGGRRAEPVIRSKR
jgi:hypothetical protein